MRFTLIQILEFASQWRKMRLSDDDLRALENLIMANPAIGKLMAGTGGLRKMRFVAHWQERRDKNWVCLVPVLFGGLVDRVICETGEGQSDGQRTEPDTTSHQGLGLVAFAAVIEWTVNYEN